MLGCELLADRHPFALEGISPLRLQALITETDPLPARKQVKYLDHDVDALIGADLEKVPELRKLDGM